MATTSTLLRQQALSAIAAILLAVASASSTAQSKPIGFSLQVSVDGTMVAKAIVSKVQPDSQAKAAGLSSGDELIRVEGIEVPGNSASTLKPHMEFLPGKPKRLMFMRADGSTYEATLTKAPQ